MPRKTEPGEVIAELPRLTWEGQFDKQMLAPLRLPGMLQRSATIAALMRELKRERRREAARRRGRGAPLKRLLADEDRFALAYIVMLREFWHKKPHSAAGWVAGAFSPGRGRGRTTLISPIGEIGFELKPVVTVGNDVDRDGQINRGGSLLHKLGTLNPAELEWCRLSARNLALIAAGIPAERTEDNKIYLKLKGLLAVRRLAQLGWNGKLPVALRKQQKQLREFAKSRPRH